MEKEMNDSQRIRDVYAFLNQQMKHFESEKELEAAVNGLLESLGMQFEAEAVRLYKCENGTDSMTNAWPDFDRGCKTDDTWQILLSDAGHAIARLMVINAKKDRDLLDEISDMLGNWLVSRLVKRDYRNRDNRVQKLLSGLGNDYTAVYVINLDTDTFEIIINQRSNNVAKEQKFSNFSSYLDNYANKYVLEDSREHMKRILRFTNLREKFKQREDLYFRFHTQPNSIGQTYFEAHAVCQYEENGHFAVIGFRCVDEVVKREQMYQRELDEAYRNAQQLDVIASSIQGGIKISYDDPMYTFKYVSKQYASMLGYDRVEELMEASNGTILDKNELMQKTIELESTKKAEQVKMQFLARMSHDIRTPLNGIIGLMEYEDRHPNDLKMITVNRKKAHAAANHLLSLTMIFWR